MITLPCSLDKTSTGLQCSKAPEADEIVVRALTVSMNWVENVDASPDSRSVLMSKEEQEDTAILRGIEGSADLFLRITGSGQISILDIHSPSPCFKSVPRQVNPIALLGGVAETSQCYIRERSIIVLASHHSSQR